MVPFQRCNLDCSLGEKCVRRLGGEHRHWPLACHLHFLLNTDTVASQEAEKIASLVLQNWGISNVIQHREKWGNALIEKVTPFNDQCSHPISAGLWLCNYVSCMCWLFEYLTAPQCRSPLSATLRLWVHVIYGFKGQTEIVNGVMLSLIL